MRRSVLDLLQFAADCSVSGVGNHGLKQRKNRYIYREIALMFAVALVGCWLPSFEVRADDSSAVDFQRDVRPLLSDKCYACHGPSDEDRQGGFRLDQRASALGEADSGDHPIVPGDAQSSGLYQRIMETDEFMQMPPPDANKSLSQEEIDLLRRWIDQGASWSEHWSLVAPRRAPLPDTAADPWCQNPIDAFVLRRLRQEEMPPSPSADKLTLLRRVTFDLTGLPPTLKEIEEYQNDSSPNAYERLVDRLLQSPHYGEHMARFWLDAARYGDTHGLHLDNYREMWPYRDWVVRAFNGNMPFDQFTIEQLAGDLLENATLDQQVASGFNRCHVTTSEGGSIQEEVYVRNVVDRVVTTGTVFMGLTFDCTRCHDHKYDPLTMNDFYGMFAFFNSLDGSPLDGNRRDHAPVVKIKTAAQQQEIASLNEQINAVQTEIQQKIANYAYVEPEKPAGRVLPEPSEFVWIEDDVPAGAKAEGGWKFVMKQVHSGKKASVRTAEGLSQHFFTGASQKLRVSEGDVLFTYVYLDPQNPPQEVMLQWNDGSWDHRAYWGENKIDWGQDNSTSRRHMGDLPPVGEWTRLEIPVDQVGLKADSLINGWAFTQFDGTVYWDKAGIVSQNNQQPIYDSLRVWLADQRQSQDQDLPDDLRTILQVAEGDRTADQKQQLRDYFLEYIYSGNRETMDPLHERILAIQEQIAAIEAKAATTLVYRERKQPKPAYYLHRGEYDQKRDQVERATPAALPPMAEELPRNRLGLAKWLLDPSHPLTARVAVNRFWQQVFGTAIVRTAEDFGSQGEVPSHPQLLDWLAVDFRENDWDVKQLMRLLVTSATYQQSSAASPDAYQRDPANRLLARGPRFRLDAEMLRDQALAVGGLLVDQQGGPSVKPPQPDGLWFAVGYSGSDTVRFKADVGPDKVHRRTLYTFIKRTAPPPELSILDAPSRESCCVRRERTNTPLQALMLMNDPQYFEAARGLAERTLDEAEATDAARASYMFRLCTARVPSDWEVSELLKLQQDQLQLFQQVPSSATELLSNGTENQSTEGNDAELAAWTMVANLVLNLDEVVSKN